MAARTIIRLASVTLSLGLILAFAITAAAADLPACRNCIDASDIARNGVGSSEIKDGAVQRGDLALGASAAAGTIMLDVLANTDAVAPAVDELDRFKVTAPGPGYLFVQVTGKFWVDINEADSTQPFHRLALCTTPTAVNGSACGASSAQEEGIIYGDGNVSATHETPYFSLSRVLRVDRAGKTTFYLNGQVPVQGEVLSLIGPVRATAMFVPRGLTIEP